MEGNGVGDLFLALLPQPVHDPLGVVFGPLVVVGIVQQASDAPDLGIAAVPGGRARITISTARAWPGAKGWWSRHEVAGEPGRE